MIIRTSVNCEGEWLDWDECDKDCGSGSQSRERRITEEAKYCGDCEIIQHRTCNTEKCQRKDKSYAISLYYTLSR